MKTSALEAPRCGSGRPALRRPGRSPVASDRHQQHPDERVDQHQLVLRLPEQRRVVLQADELRAVGVLERLLDREDRRVDQARPPSRASSGPTNAATVSGLLARPRTRLMTNRTTAKKLRSSPARGTSGGTSQVSSRRSSCGRPLVAGCASWRSCRCAWWSARRCAGPAWWPAPTISGQISRPRPRLLDVVEGVLRRLARCPLGHPVPDGPSRPQQASGPKRRTGTGCSGPAGSPRRSWSGP